MLINIARGTTDPGYWVQDLNKLFPLKLFQINFSHKHDSSYRLNALGPLCLWQCFSKRPQYNCENTKHNCSNHNWHLFKCLLIFDQYLNKAQTKASLHFFCIQIIFLMLLTSEASLRATDSTKHNPYNLLILTCPRTSSFTSQFKRVLSFGNRKNKIEELLIHKKF